MAVPWLQYAFQFLTLMSSFNISLAIFNLIPIPPLDGFHLVNDTIFGGRIRLDPQVFRVLQAILIALCLFGALNGVLSVAINAVYSFFLQLFLLIPVL